MSISVNAIALESDPFIKSNVPDVVVRELVSVMNRLIADQGITETNIIYIATKLMTALGKYKDISGHDKKTIVVLLINSAVDQSSLDETTQTIIQSIVSNVLPSTIDILVDISKGRYSFKKVTTSFSCCK
jgi:basic membrane lipoprotein Med (substrate-binding protein (PBP1-ABC) superfamily)